MFRDRRDAGRQLARALTGFGGPDVVVLGLPRGGVPVAYEVARALDAPLDVIVVRKLGFPGQPEFAMGAIGEDGVRVLDDDTLRAGSVTARQLADVEQRERRELERRSEQFRRVRPRVELTGRTALVVDDGIATGSTARAACLVARAHGAVHVVLAAPVAPSEAIDRLADAADDLVVWATPTPFLAVGRFYVDFTPTTDDEVVRLLEEAAEADPGPR